MARRLAPIALLALALAVPTGCDRNQPGTALAPTGIRPAPAVWPGGVTGTVRFDPLNTPDLGAPPYPPTRVELWRDTARVAVDSLAPASNAFTFGGVQPGTYSVVVRSAAFRANSLGGIRVRDEVIDAGNITLTLDPTALSAGMEIIGTIPGFTVSDLNEFLFPIDVSELSVVSGLWSYPSVDYPDGQPIPAGTYRFKFATVWPSTAANMTGWGDAIGGPLTAPVSHHPAVLATGPASDIVMTFPTAGVYAFTLDERRQTFSVQYLHAAPARPARLARR